MFLPSINGEVVQIKELEWIKYGQALNHTSIIQYQQVTNKIISSQKVDNLVIKPVLPKECLVMLLELKLLKMYKFVKLPFTH